MVTARNSLSNSWAEILPLASLRLSGAHGGPQAAARQTMNSVARHLTRKTSIRLGFVPLTDCAPVVMACELGLFEKHGLDVTLRREIGWASIRDKIIFGELDAAHALAAMPFAITMGLGSVRCACETAIVLNCHGNAITLSRQLHQLGVRDVAGLASIVRAGRLGRRLMLGTVFPHSAHTVLLREWLKSGGIDPDQDVDIVVVPPPGMVASLRAGNLDGFCVGEPWNTLAVQAGIGWCPVPGCEISPGHPEKVLLVKSSFAEERAGEHLRLVAALHEACAWCQAPQHRELLSRTLARPEYLNVDAGSLMPALSGNFDMGAGRMEHLPDFIKFHGDGVNAPSPVHAAWILRHLRQMHPAAFLQMPVDAMTDNIFDRDSFLSAIRLLNDNEPHETIADHEPQLAEV